jgi:hypothetical protein
MAYISTESIAKIRNEIKQRFPAKDGWKISIKKEHYSGVRITILQGPVNFLPEESKKIKSSFFPDKSSHPYLQQIYNIANSGNHDNSDAMSDYFDVGWYIWLNIGEYGNEYQFVRK